MIGWVYNSVGFFFYRKKLLFAESSSGPFERDREDKRRSWWKMSSAKNPRTSLFPMSSCEKIDSLDNRLLPSARVIHVDEPKWRYTIARVDISCTYIRGKSVRVYPPLPPRRNTPSAILFVVNRGKIDFIPPSPPATRRAVSLWLRRIRSKSWPTSAWTTCRSYNGGRWLKIAPWLMVWFSALYYGSRRLYTKFIPREILNFRDINLPFVRYRLFSLLSSVYRSFLFANVQTQLFILSFFYNIIFTYIFY